ncbi:MAG: SulP family inorganic anion transporter [Aeromicrobium sp.]|uniref:SulP family inorganic anion transporter n=1 Tax=Aeromicrobium sp. TaxID=1871063 RepID=UPI002624E91C|nr:SulP family inorganic anion transporter [Aeromicrobium sp.]MDF1705999.1 SulP family inorganic anion transporter [Aeromicrobium sp.]
MTTTNHPSENPAPSVRAALRSPTLLRTEVLAGLVVALALIPEAISFSIIAGVDPQVGLFASFTMAVAISFLGGRPAMISAATGAIALVVAPVMREHGYDYLIATVLLGGVIQVLLAVVGVAKLMRFIPRSVMVGFVNALAILIFGAQLDHMIDVPWSVYVMIAVGIAVIVAFPRVNRVVPAPLVAIVALTAFTLVAAVNVPNVGDQGDLPDSLPTWFLPDVPLTLETLQIIAPYALAMALVGILESLLTAKLVDDITDTHSDKTREAWGQGAANVVTGFFGGMGGCAMIGQTMINVKVSGARTRISTFLAGVFLLVLVVGFGDVVALIPMAALVAVMIMVSVGTFDWHSVRPSTLRRMPKSETTVMLSTVLVTVLTHNLAIGVGVGVLVAMTLFARRVAHLTETNRHLTTDDGGREIATYHVTGELFFASSNDLYTQFDYAGDPDQVVIDLSDSHVWDASTVASLDAITTKYERKGKTVTITGLDDASAERHGRLSGRLPSH